MCLQIEIDSLHEDHSAFVESFCIRVVSDHCVDRKQKYQGTKMTGRLSKTFAAESFCPTNIVRSQTNTIRQAITAVKHVVQTTRSVHGNK